VHNPAEAGMEVGAYDRQLWKHKETRLREFPLLKKWAARLYREGDSDLQTCFVQSVLEHLLEDGKIADYFSDWKNDPILQQAYAEAMAWAIDHPR
jgi:hypothetical protein